jgi:(E)-4-hydroxy-3-methylbut-2-enyl-diphosphate synthase
MESLARRQTPVVDIDHVKMGGNTPIVIQSMTNTLTRDIAKTVLQSIELADAGSELVRITVNDKEAMRAVPEIVKQLRDQGYQTPIVGDFHYNGHLLLTQFPKGAAALSKFRINPGNVGVGDRRDENFETFIRIAKDLGKPVRIGVNWGSLDKQLFTALMDENARRKNPKEPREVVIEAMVKSALGSAELAIRLGLTKEQLVLSVKMSHLPDMVAAYRQLADACDTTLHLGLTEAGSDMKGIIASSAALAILLYQGIGDTIRISLTPQPGVPRSREVEACKHLLQSLNLRHFKPEVTSCPGCGRTDSEYFIHLAQDVNKHIAARIQKWLEIYPGVEKLTVAVMGCVVNGPGESKFADIGISLPGLREAPVAPVFVNGEKLKILKGERITEEFLDIFDDYVEKRFGKAPDQNMAEKTIPL